MAELSHTSTVFNNIAAHAPFALDEVLDRFFIFFFYIFSSRLLFCSNRPIKGESTMTEAVRSKWNLGTLTIISYILSFDNYQNLVKT